MHRVEATQRLFPEGYPTVAIEPDKLPSERLLRVLQIVQKTLSIR